MTADDNNDVFISHCGRAKTINQLMNFGFEVTFWAWVAADKLSMSTDLRPVLWQPPYGTDEPGRSKVKVMIRVALRVWGHSQAIIGPVGGLLNQGCDLQEKWDIIFFSVVSDGYVKLYHGNHNKFYCSHRNKDRKQTHTPGECDLSLTLNVLKLLLNY